MIINLKDLTFDKFNRIEKPTLVLKTLSEETLGTLGYATQLKISPKFNELSEISFELPAFSGGQPTPLYEKVTGFKIVLVAPFGKFILTNPQTTGNGRSEIKSCTGYSLEYELARKKIFLPKGTYNFHNPLAFSSGILGLIQEIVPNWKIGEVDSLLVGKYRTFDVIDENLLSFISGTLQQTYGCIFVFDTDTRTINIQAATTTVPSLPIYLSFDNLLKSSTVSELTDGVVTELNVYGADPVSIRGVNPTGSNKIYNLDYFIGCNDISKPLALKWKAWQETFLVNQPLYSDKLMLRSVQVARLLSENARLTSLEGQLGALKATQSVIVQGVSDGTGSREDLAAINEKIGVKNREISSQEALLSSISLVIGSYDGELDFIRERVSFSAHFSAQELLFLKQYFIEDTLSDSTFALYETSGEGAPEFSDVLSGGTISFSQAILEEVFMPDTLEKRMFHIKSGRISFLGGVCALQAEVISGTLEYLLASKDFVLTAYLGDGSILQTQGNEGSAGNEGNEGSAGSAGSLAFPSGNLSACGLLSDFSLGPDVLSFSFERTALYFTKSITEYQQMSLEMELYEYAVDVLSRSAYPSYTFEIESGNLLFLKVFSPFKDVLALGCSIHLQLNDQLLLHPVLLALDIDFENPSNFKMLFSNQFKLSDATSNLTALLEKTASSSRNVDFNRFHYGSFTDSGVKSLLRNFMDSALDVSKNAILGGSQQAISWDGSGFHLRRWNEDKTAYLPDEIGLLNNNIVFTNDSWHSAKMAIGKFVDGNLGNCWGIVAPNIVGTLLAGENLVIENRSPQGKHVQFKVDGSGVFLNNARFLSSYENAQIAIDPSIGLVIGKNPLYSVNAENSLILNRENANFFADSEGNLTLKGSVYASCGLFQGTIQAGKYLDALGRDMFLDNKFQAGFLELKGLNVNDNFMIDENGNVTIHNGSISWGAVSGTDALDHRLDQIENSIPVLPDYIKSTYIDGTSVSSPVIRGGMISGAVFTDLPNKQGEPHKSELYLAPNTNFNLADLIFNRADGQSIFKIIDDATSANLFLYGNEVLYAGPGITYPMGKWDFRKSQVSGVTATFA